MKKIIVLTDLTEESSQATAAAVMLSSKLHANLVLFNTFISQPALSEYGGNPWYTQEILWVSEGKAKLAALKEDAVQEIAALSSDEHHASIDCRQGIGNLGMQVKDLQEKESIEMVVMGARTDSGWEHMLMGSDTVSVINHTNRPVMIIPAAHPLKQLKKVTIAVDFDGTDLNAVHYLTRIGRVFDFAIEIAHVKLWGEEGKEEMSHSTFEKHVAKFNYPHISYQYVGGKELINRLHSICKVNGSDLLVLVHDKHNLIDRMVKKPHANTLIEKQEIPVMIIPSCIDIH